MTGARFIDYLGLEESEIYKIIDKLNKYAKEQKIEIVGADVMEIDQSKAGQTAARARRHAPACFALARFVQWRWRHWLARTGNAPGEH